MEEQLRTGRVELGAAQLRASELEGAMADMEKTHREQLQSQGTASSKALVSYYPCCRTRFPQLQLNNCRSTAKQVARPSRAFFFASCSLPG